MEWDDYPGNNREPFDNSLSAVVHYTSMASCEPA